MESATQKESSPHRDKEKEETEEKAKEASTMKKDSEHKEKVIAEEEVTDQNSNRINNNNNNQNQHNNPISEASPSSITFQSPSPPSSSLRTRKSPSSSPSPSPSLHSPSDSPISDGHSSAGHISSSAGHISSSPPPQNSLEFPISDGHFSVGDDVSPIGVERFSPAAPPVVVAHRFQVEPKVVTKVDPGAEEGFVDVNDTKHAAVSGGSEGGGVNRRLRPDVTGLLRSKKIAMLSKVLLGLRFTSLMFCLMSLSVLAADKEKGWALDSFYRYKEFRFSLSVNVIGFVYSGLQICDLVKYLITRKHLVDHRIKGFFNFALDQILTYLLMSASSSAATRAYDWESNWGVDKFPGMANASVALSFVAFMAFAFTSLVSFSILCRFR